MSFRLAGSVLVSLTLTALLLARVVGSMPVNFNSIDAARNIGIKSGCALSGYNLKGQNNTGSAQPQTPYLTALYLAAGKSGSEFPQEAQWSRDPRLYNWFYAQTLIRQQRHAESVAYLKKAEAGQVLLASAHIVGQRGDIACAIFNRLIADEIGVGNQPNDVEEWAMSFVNSGRADIVIKPYALALTYRPERADWRLVLASAYLILDHVSEAESVLQPLLATGSAEVAAKKLLEDYKVRKKLQP